MKEAQPGTSTIVGKQKLLKFGLSEKHTKFEKNLPYGFDKSADLLSKRQNHKADFFKLCVLFKKSELYKVSSPV